MSDYKKGFNDGARAMAEMTNVSWFRVLFGNRSLIVDGIISKHYSEPSAPVNSLKNTPLTDDLAGIPVYDGKTTAGSD